VPPPHTGSSTHPYRCRSPRRYRNPRSLVPAKHDMCPRRPSTAGYCTTASFRRHHAPERRMHGSSSAFQVARPPATHVPCSRNAGARQHMSDASAERAAMPLSSAKQLGPRPGRRRARLAAGPGRPQCSTKVGRSPVVHAVGSARAGNAVRSRLTHCGRLAGRAVRKRTTKAGAHNGEFCTHVHRSTAKSVTSLSSFSCSPSVPSATPPACASDILVKRKRGKTRLEAGMLNMRTNGDDAREGGASACICLCSTEIQATDGALLGWVLASSQRARSFVSDDWPRSARNEGAPNVRDDAGAQALTFSRGLRASGGGGQSETALPCQAPRCLRC
jgi:hypothetical protein